MKQVLTKHRMNWEPIKSPIFQNLILGTVTGLMVGINLRVIILSGGEATWAWITLFLIGPLFGLFSGIERTRMERKNKERMKK